MEVGFSSLIKEKKVIWYHLLKLSKNCYVWCLKRNKYKGKSMDFIVLVLSNLDLEWITLRQEIMLVVREGQNFLNFYFGEILDNLWNWIKWRIWRKAPAPSI